MTVPVGRGLRFLIDAWARLANCLVVNLRHPSEHAVSFPEQPFRLLYTASFTDRYYFDAPQARKVPNSTFLADNGGRGPTTDDFSRQPGDPHNRYDSLFIASRINASPHLFDKLETNGSRDVKNSLLCVRNDCCGVVSNYSETKTRLSTACGIEVVRSPPARSLVIETERLKPITRR